MDPTQYKALQNFYQVTRKQLEDALAKERLELQNKYSRYLMSNDLPIILLDCFL